jgi:threonine synthase
MQKENAGLINRYFDKLPIKNKKNIVTLNEGNTPLVRLSYIESCHNYNYKIYAKIEGANPTGSFKDRGMTVAISHAKEKSAKAVLCASTGNTSASAAAYAARAGMQAFVIIPEGKIAMGKLVQALVHGAQIIQIKGNFDDAMHIVKEATSKLPIELVNSVNPYRLEGQKTAAFEIIDELNQAPDYHCLPVGNAGNISAYWMGYKEYYTSKNSSTKPAMLGFQAKGAAPFLSGGPVVSPETIATAIRIGAPQSWDKAINAVTESEGWFSCVTDDEILAAQSLLATKEGIFCEPASAASVAGLLIDLSENKLVSGSTIVCTLTGNGLKDPDIIMSQFKEPIPTLPADLSLICDKLEESITT